MKGFGARGEGTLTSQLIVLKNVNIELTKYHVHILDVYEKVKKANRSDDLVHDYDYSDLGTEPDVKEYDYEEKEKYKEESEEADESVDEDNLKALKFRRRRDLSPEPNDLTLDYEELINSKSIIWRGN